MVFLGGFFWVFLGGFFNANPTFFTFLRADSFGPPRLTETQLHPDSSLNPDLDLQHLLLHNVTALPIVLLNSRKSLELPWLSDIFLNSAKLDNL